MASGGFFGSLGNAVRDLVKETEKALDITIENNPIFDDGRGSQRLYQKFGVSEVLLGEFSCRVVNSNDLLSGEVYITPSTLYFSAPWRNPNGLDSLIKVILPFKSINNLQQAGHVPSVNPKLPAIVPLNAYPQIKPTVIQVFTSDNLIHQFLGFGEAYFKSWNILSYAWRTFHNKPHPDNCPPPYILQQVQQIPPGGSVPVTQTVVLTPTLVPPTKQAPVNTDVKSQTQVNKQTPDQHIDSPMNLPIVPLDPPLEPEKAYTQIPRNNK